MDERKGWSSDETRHFARNFQFFSYRSLPEISSLLSPFIFFPEISFSVSDRRPTLLFVKFELAVTNVFIGLVEKKQKRKSAFKKMVVIHMNIFPLFCTLCITANASFINCKINVLIEKNGNIK